MRIILGKRKITKILNNFLKEFNVKAKFGRNFCYYPDSEIINVALAVDDTGSKMFMKYLEHIAPDIEIDTFLIAFLHELGHHMTCDEITPEEELYCLYQREYLDDMVKQTDNPFDLAEYYIDYFTLPDEAAATNWAVDFIRNDTEKVAKLWNELRPAIMRFYKINRVEVE